MDVVAKLKAALLLAQQQRSAKALLAPEDPTAFGYGQASGYARGIHDALQIIDATVKETAEEERKNGPTPGHF